MDTRTQRRFFSSTLFLIILTFLTAVHTDRSFCTDPTTPPRSILTRPVAFRHGEWYIQLHDKGRGTRWVKYCQIVDGDMWNVGVVGKAEGRLKELEMG
ncbi:hypothetical protein BC829DRAFT_445717 [Chytridium lagenaria]|nr:hypothetical protein BC829DRAFT_445717 [Chytridium lagenaria]